MGGGSHGARLAVGRVRRVGRAVEGCDDRSARARAVEEQDGAKPRERHRGASEGEESRAIPSPIQLKAADLGPLSV